MKKLKIVLLILTIGFSSTANATSNFQIASTIGPVTILKLASASKASLDVIGNHEYYFRYNNYRLNYKKIQEVFEAKKENLPLSCLAEEQENETCK